MNLGFSLNTCDAMLLTANMIVILALAFNNYVYALFVDLRYRKGDIPDIGKWFSTSLLQCYMWLFLINCPLGIIHFHSTQFLASN